MSLTGRPSRPPLALVSCSQICIASSAALPLGASPPVSAMPKPMVSGLPCAAAVPARPAAAPATASFPNLRRSMSIAIPSYCLLVSTLHQGRWPREAERMLAENAALQIGRKHHVGVCCMCVAEQALHAAGHVEAAGTRDSHENVDGLEAHAHREEGVASIAHLVVVLRRTPHPRRVHRLRARPPHDEVGRVDARAGFGDLDLDRLAGVDRKTGVGAVALACRTDR